MSGVLDNCRLTAEKTVWCSYMPTHCAASPCGRLPAGLVAAELAHPVAAAAWLEGAAVFAFEALERELIAHGSPTGLIERAKKAQRDEKRHHRAMSALAARFGAAVQPVEPPRLAGVRPLFEVALENAVEGCVRETWGAAVAAFQSEAATDRAVRRAMSAIAVDEAEHAALGWAVDDWACSCLSSGERNAVVAARAKAHQALVAHAERAVPRAAFGLPDAAASLRMLVELRPIWAA